jgi:HEPN domain-containing protein
MSFLVENSRSFLRAAKRDLEEGEYNLAMFHAEQALQLCVISCISNTATTLRRIG